MVWQELVILAGSLIANAALIPTIRDPTSKVAFRTSALTAGILSVQTTMFVSMGLTTTAIGNAIGVCLWSLILFLRTEWRFSLDCETPLDASAGNYQLGDD